MTEIHDNLPSIQLPFFTVFDWIILSLFLLGMIFFLWKFLWRREENQKKTGVKKAKIQKFLPEKFSLPGEIEKLKTLQKEEQWKEFSLESTKLLKKILEQKFKKSFAFATGKELEEILQEKISALELKNITNFFALLDPVKFAKVSGKQELAEKILEILPKMYKNK